MARILILHFSTPDDAALSLPVLLSLAVQYPRHSLMVVGREACAPLYEALPDNLLFRGIDLRGEHAGLMGLAWLYRELSEERFDTVVDWQRTLRSTVLCWRFRLAGIPTVRCGKHPERQKPAFLRYADVLAQAGYSVRPASVSLFGNRKGDIRSLFPLTGSKDGDRWIGIAPFATHTGKLHPLFREERLVERLASRPAVKLFLFGRSKKERAALEQWEKKFPRVVSTAGRLTPSRELALISHLDVMLAADPVCLHLAPLVRVPAVSLADADPDTLVRRIESLIGMPYVSP